MNFGEDLLGETLLRGQGIGSVVQGECGLILDLAASDGPGKLARNFGASGQDRFENLFCHLIDDGAGCGGDGGRTEVAGKERHFAKVLSLGEAINAQRRLAGLLDHNVEESFENEVERVARLPLPDN